ncbi:PTS sugar transporter subunit IIA [Gemella sp. GH3]|uniref:PTS sugar transporter subunit IIA n=1 Tax=unclassified Gemella TaxID=2624949 RepID=UPI0015CFFB5E|nr:MULTISPECIES: PTS sugar transporter subunit IIA [unclassified Gemella]MBF0714017.1 PTS sugar transporter subunit IIA [Gemella sp. GH3.1]NYS50969.1 PTS sugar transporter subunit IIA [Gemella sp. GH3]
MEKYFSNQKIYIDVEGENFSEVLKNVTEDLERKGYINNEFFSKVLEREKEFPTGLEFPEHNIAIPHTDPVYVKESGIVVIKPKKSVVFRDMGTNAKDLNVDIILLLLISHNEEQVKVLSSIINKFANKEFYNNILRSDEKEEIYKILVSK